MFASLALLSCGKSGDGGASSADGRNPQATVTIDFDASETASDFAEVVALVLAEPELSDLAEGQLQQLFAQALADSLVNDLVTLLRHQPIRDCDLLAKIFTPWGRTDRSQGNKHRLGPVVRTVLRDPQLDQSNAECIIELLDARYDNGRHCFKTQSHAGK
jgi:hypothetical protein